MNGADGLQDMCQEANAVPWRGLRLRIGDTSESSGSAVLT